MIIIVNETNTYVKADEGKLLYFVGDNKDNTFSECYVPGVATEADFVEIKIEEVDLNNIIEK